MYGPPVSDFVLALFFTISTLRLPGLAARGLRYRYGEKFRYKLWLRAHVHVGWRKRWLFQARTGRAKSFGQCSSPSIATASACWLKKLQV